MSFHLTCPTDPAHVRFEVTASVQEIWEVGPTGQFVDVIGSGPDVSSRPDEGNLYNCLECGDVARMTKDPI